ncbi:MAG: MBL fold metallo-hydrolase [Cyanobacteriota bacterium]
MPSDSFDSKTTASKLPRQILERVFAFPPNRETLGATSYFIVENSENILIDCPVWDETNQQFLLEQGGVRWLHLTHRSGIGKRVNQIQEMFGCEIVIHEREAYLLPEAIITPFEDEYQLSDRTLAIWTPGHSPGSSCLYFNASGGVLFTGRHLLPNSQGKPVPLRSPKTFHWWRQLDSIQKLCDRFSPDNLHYICPGANTGFLRGKGVIDNAYSQLAELDLTRLRDADTVL